MIIVLVFSRNPVVVAADFFGHFVSFKASNMPIHNSNTAIMDLNYGWKVSFLHRFCPHRALQTLIPRLEWKRADTCGFKRFFISYIFRFSRVFASMPTRDFGNISRQFVKKLYNHCIIYFPYRYKLAMKRSCHLVGGASSNVGNPVVP